MGVRFTAGKATATSIPDTESISDEERFQQTLHSLSCIGIVHDTLRDLLRTLCMVLQLGNLIFIDNDDDSGNSNNINTTNDVDDGTNATSKNRLKYLSLNYSRQNSDMI